MADEHDELVARIARNQQLDEENERWTTGFFSEVKHEALLWMGGKRPPLNADAVHATLTYAQERRDEVAILLGIVAGQKAEIERLTAELTTVRERAIREAAAVVGNGTSFRARDRILALLDKPDTSKGADRDD